MGNKPVKKPDLYDVSFDLKMSARSMEKQAQKMEAGEKAQTKKILDVSTAFVILTVVLVPLQEPDGPG